MKERFFLAAAIVAAVLVLGFCSSVSASPQAKVDVTGAWTFAVESAAGASAPMVTFKQEGESLTGHYSSQLMGEAELKGTVKGQTIEFTVTAEVQGFRIDLKYSGTIDSKDSMKGKMSAGEFGDGTFTAKRN